MSESKQKPSRWYYGLAILIPIFACGLTTYLVYRNVPKLPGAVEATGINNLTRVIVPGSVEIFFPKAGAYAVYYEYRSVIDGVRYIHHKYPPKLNCVLKSKASGADVELASPNVEGNIYSTKNQEHVGVLLKSISINQPGVHILSCRYMDGSSNPQIVLAVGPNFIWEFFNIAAKPVAAFVCGAIVFVGAFGLSMVIISFVAYKRHQSKNILASQT